MSTAYAIDQTGKMVTIAAGYVTAAFRDPIADILYTAASDDVSARFTSATARLIGTWTKRFVFAKYEGLAWLEVESDFLDADGITAVTAAVTITDAAGATLYSGTISGRTPVRLPPFRVKELVVSVVSKAKISKVHLSSSTAELKVQ